MTRQLSNLFTLLIINSLFISLPAQELARFEISGNKVFENQFYIDFINQNPNLTREEFTFRLSKELSSQGYFNSKIIQFSLDTVSNSNSPKYNLEIREGSPTYVSEIIIDSLTSDDSVEVIDFFSFFMDKVFIQSELENRIQETLVYLENKGFPFAKFTINSLEFFEDDDLNYVNIYLSLDKYKLRKIDKVEIIGNDKTNDDVIINAARLNKGEIYSHQRILAIPETLNKLRFFSDIKEPRYYINSNEEGILQITLTEKNTNTFDGIIGYVPSTTSNESGYFTGFVNISLRNLFGTGRGAAFKWQQENSSTQELEIDYLEPWIFNQPLNLNFQFFQRKQDSSYVKRIIGGSVEYLATENIAASVLVESESIIASINKSNQLARNSSSINSGIRLKVDYRDNIIAPRSGSYFISTYKYRNKKIGKEEELPSSIKSRDVEYHNYELDFGIFYSLFGNQVLAFGIHAKEIIGDYFDISDYFQFGGTNTLRGYREKQFLGNRIIWSNLEYRFLLSQTSYVFTFFDTGYYLISKNEDINIEGQSDYKSGYGVGISLETALGVMKV
ncbi:MAG: BamA/TamA family outer membrane protein, partial [Melioribacteraceae bacterium]|nr:BamA/TamA family outer membrane protein [Melioribacteraceae bacterium]